jgi:diguanylate cyclase (GGDEF)-like protein
MAARVAVFCGPSLRKNLSAGSGRGVRYEFFASRAAAGEILPASVDAALMELTPATRPPSVKARRRQLGSRPLGSVSRGVGGTPILSSERLGFDFHLISWGPGDPPAREVLAHVEAARRQGRRARAPRVSPAAKRLEILTDIVKTANSILEPKKVIDLIMAKIQRLIPSEAWSILMVDEKRQLLTFELALGKKAQDVSSLRVKIGQGIAGWVAATGKPVIVNNARRDRRFSPEYDDRTTFKTRSVLCAPLISRGRTIGVVEIINRRGGRFSAADRQILLTLVEPCAIAIENATLFQKTERLTVTDDLTQLFNSRYLTLYLDREIKRCKRHGIPLSLIFLDLDGFKEVNDWHGHLAGSSTLSEVGRILTGAVRESDILVRYGGDEFVAVLPETPAEGALVIAERIRESIEAHSFLGDMKLAVRISASFGIACFPEHALTPGGLIQKADQAMYRVKERDKNGVELAV